MDLNRLSLSHYQGKRVVVLGATGFIGRWVARQLSDQGSNLFLVVRDKASAEVIFNRYQIKGKIYEIDLQDDVRVRSMFQELRPAITFNLAGYGIDRNERDETLAYQLNTHLAEVICQAVAPVRDPAWRGQDIVHVGTAMEYGAVRGSLTEDTLPNPVELYGKTKLAGTLAFSEACRALGLKGLTARLFTIYGPGELPGRLLPSLMRIAVNGGSLPMTAGLQKRDFVYVEDAALGLTQLGLAEATPGDIVNIATGRLTAIRDFVSAAAEVLKVRSEQLVFGALPVRTEEMEHDPVSNDHLVSLTFWSPPTTIEDGIRKTMLFEYGTIPEG